MHPGLPRTRGTGEQGKLQLLQDRELAARLRPWRPRHRHRHRRRPPLLVAAAAAAVLAKKLPTSVQRGSTKSPTRLLLLPHEGLSLPTNAPPGPPRRARTRPAGPRVELRCRLKQRRRRRPPPLLHERASRQWGLPREGECIHHHPRIGTARLLPSESPFHHDHHHDHDHHHRCAHWLSSPS